MKSIGSVCDTVIMELWMRIIERVVELVDIEKILNGEDHARLIISTTKTKADKNVRLL